LRAVTATLSAEAASGFATPYELVVAPVIAAHGEPVAVQRSHWYE
jgi:hypothetical protein